MSSPRRAYRIARYVLESVLLWLVLTVVLFLAYEVVSAFWLPHLDPDQRDAAHLLRGIATSLTATVVTAVYVLLRVAPPIESEAVHGEHAHGSGERAPRLLTDWLLGLRWLAVVVVAAVVGASTAGELVFVEPRAVVPLWASVIALFSFNVGLMFVPAARRGTPAGLTVQVALDSAVLTLLVHHAGGVANPFSGFFVFHAVIAAIVLPRRRAIAVIAVLATWLLVLTAVEVTGIWPVGCIRDLDGICRGPDWLQLAAAGMGLFTLVVGSATFALALVGRLRTESVQLSEARTALLEEREKLSSIVECMADAVIFADPHGHIMLRNRAASRLWPNGEPSEDLRVCHDGDRWSKLLARLADPGAQESHPILRVEDRSYEATYARVADPAGQLVGVVMVARDITERLMAQEWRMREERMSVVGKLAAALAHELNNPLGVIGLYTQHALAQPDTGATLRGHLETILRNADLCKRAVRDLLDYARQRPPERTSLRAATLLDLTARTLAAPADRAGVFLSVEIDGDPTLYGDGLQLEQVLVNLGLNAIEAMDHGGTLRLAASQDGDRTSLSVSDSGPGIPEEDRERIFSPFFTTKPTGTGLGLAVVQDLVHAHGGTVELTSSSGAGSTFVLRIPSTQKTVEEAAA